jgi:hypothetical protein
MPEQAHWSYSLRNKLMVMVLIAVVLGGILSRSADFAVHAQAEGGEWSRPTLLFEVEPAEVFGRVDGPRVLADQSGHVHAFWTYGELARGNSVEYIFEDIYYTRWDGTAWTPALDIIASPQALYPRATTDSTGNLHLLWKADRLYYSQAHSSEAGTALGWTKPVSMRLESGQILADSAGRLHLASANESFWPYYQTSADHGATWSAPVSIAAPSKEISAVLDFNLAVSDDGTIHVVWDEYQLPDGWPPIGVFYSQSTDGGETWLNPVELAGEGYDDVNIVVGDDDTIHVAWNGMAGVGGRYHRWSGDGGRSWSETAMITPNGFTEGPPQLILDRAGTLHFLTTSGQRVWYSFWQNGRWAELTYLPSGDESNIPRVGQAVSAKVRHIESPAMTLSEGNRLHVVFYDRRPEERRSYIWYTTKQTSAPHVPPIPIPTQVPRVLSPTTQPTSPPPPPTPVPSPTRSTTFKPLDEVGEEVEPDNPGRSVLLGVLPVVLILGGIVLTQIISTRRR